MSWSTPAEALSTTRRNARAMSGRVWGVAGGHPQQQPQGPVGGAQTVEQQGAGSVGGGDEHRVGVVQGPGQGTVLHQGLQLRLEGPPLLLRVRQKHLEVQSVLGEEVEDQGAQGHQGTDLLGGLPEQRLPLLLRGARGLGIPVSPGPGGEVQGPHRRVQDPVHRVPLLLQPSQPLLQFRKPMDQGTPLLPHSRKARRISATCRFAWATTDSRASGGNPRVWRAPRSAGGT